MAFDLGDVVPLTVDIKDAGGLAANAGAVVLTITLPDGTTATPSVTNAPTGRYSVDYPTVQTGRHLARWVATGVNASAHTDTFDVRPAAPELLVSMKDTKATLNKLGSVVTDDDELRGLIEAVTAAVEHLVGPVVRQSKVERHNGGNLLVLNHRPVISVQSIVPILTGGVAHSVADVDVDGATGIVQRLDGACFVGPLRVSYTAGRAVIPAAIREAALIIIKHLWDLQRRPSTGGRPQPDSSGETSYVPGLGYALPNRALEQLAPYRRAPMVA